MNLAKLTESDVRAIMAELQRLPRRSMASIGAEFGISGTHVARIMHREAWAHLWAVV
jgi:hypothetical protein